MEELYFDSRIIIINKPAGVLSQGDGSNSPCVTDGYKKSPAQKFPVCAHRLDRNTSGCMILVRNPKSAKKLHRLITENRIEKTYLIICRGKIPDSGSINVPLRKYSNKSFADKRGKPAKTNFEVISRADDISLVRVNIETGRFHQIRAHFAHKRSPLLGDKKYGQGPSTRMFHRPAIHAWKLLLGKYNSDDSDLAVEAKPPDDFLKLMQASGLSL